MPVWEEEEEEDLVGTSSLYMGRISNKGRKVTLVHAEEIIQRKRSWEREREKKT